MRILFVDAGNYCRSPAAEVVARAIAHRAGLSGELAFGSAGLKDKHAGDGADPRSIAACRARGYDLTLHRCREITPQDFFENDLILAMDRENLAELERRRPRESHARLALFLGEAEVPDPYFGESDGFDTMMDQFEGGARELIGRCDRDAA
jgi:protein-tyrosine phosphatase